MSEDISYAKWAVKHYQQDIKSIADAFRRIADQIEREGQPRRDLTCADSQPDYQSAAARVIHVATWGFANANVERVISTAIEVHTARNKESA